MQIRSAHTVGSIIRAYGVDEDCVPHLWCIVAGFGWCLGHLERDEGSEGASKSHHLGLYGGSFGFQQ